MVKEAIYTIPLRNNWLNTPRWRRSKRASKYVKTFLLKHTKAEEIKISRWINEAIWSNGGKNPPGKIRVKVTEDEEGVWRADLVELSERVKRLTKQKEEIEKKHKSRLSKIAQQLKREKPKEDEEEKEKKKKKAKITKQQEMSMNK